MATNRVFEDGDQLQFVATHPTTPASGGPCRYGEMTGFALTAEDANGLTTIAFDGVFLTPVGGVDQSGNSAVAAGDRLYYTDADTPPVNKKNTGRPMGFAVATPGNPGTVASAGTGTIGVRLATF